MQRFRQSDGQLFKKGGVVAIATCMLMFRASRLWRCKTAPRHSRQLMSALLINKGSMRRLPAETLLPHRAPSRQKDFSRPVSLGLQCGGSRLH